MQKKIYWQSLYNIHTLNLGTFVSVLGPLQGTKRITHNRRDGTSRAPIMDGTSIDGGPRTAMATNTIKGANGFPANSNELTDSTSLARPAHYKAPTSSKSTRAQEPLAVIGMGCRLPGDANNPHALAQLLKRGGVAHNEAPDSRFHLHNHYDGSNKSNTMRSPGGMFLENIDPRHFDAGFFEVPTPDAIAMDPQQRQLLEVVYECLENSGVTLRRLSGAQIGCFVGSYAVGVFTPHEVSSSAMPLK